MKRLLGHCGSLMALCTVEASAVVIPPELANTESTTAGALYVFILIVFIVGLLIGIRLQKRMGRSARFEKPL